ncbi:site-specific integrase [Psychromonas sp. SP041]|uniref:tyrosine-type recombinase/integrase n=1 Tax=Psychromonas sp. SP041 TaxID=1365007 RepID=UPI0010C77E09|nr:site-specific integrase [Psychromonas sp. SP041]
MNTKIKPPFPIFGTHKQVRELNRNFPYPEDIPFIRREVLLISAQLPFCEQDYAEAVHFLSEYGRRSAQTFNAFRTETERFLLWSWLIAEKSVISLRKSDINDYIDFCMNPPVSWVNTQQAAHFVRKNSKTSGDDDKLEEYTANKAWKPFKVTEPISPRATRVKRTPQTKSIERQFSIMKVFYDFMIDEDYALGNPVPVAKKRSPYIIKSSEPPTIKRFSEDDWETILQYITEAADEDPLYERNLFAVVTLKSLYLRISEISERDNWQPKMSDFHESNESYWFWAFGKGGKKRRVSIPDAYFKYLKRYRVYRGLTPMPTQSDNSPLISKLKGRGGISTKQSSRLIEDAFTIVINRLTKEGQISKATEIMSASSHWLRHTGASIDALTRPIKHLSDDLGHTSMATTDKEYIQSTLMERGKTGKVRKV